MILAVLLSPFLLTIEMWIISFIIGYMISMLQMEIGLHRYFSHSSFYTNKIIHNILSFLSTVACAGPIIAWVHIHLHHHTNSDTEKDPHSPDNIGKIKAFFRGWFIFNYNYFSDYSIRCRKDKTLAFFEKTDRAQIHNIQNMEMIYMQSILISNEFSANSYYNQYSHFYMVF